MSEYFVDLDTGSITKIRTSDPYPSNAFAVYPPFVRLVSFLLKRGRLDAGYRWAQRSIRWWRFFRCVYRS